MSSQQIQTAAAAVVYLLCEDDKNKKIRNRKCWVREWIQRREQFGFYKQLMNELKAEDPMAFKNFMRISHSDFDELLHMITPLIKKQDTNMRKSISCGERLAVTLRFLATGDSYHSLMYAFRIPVTTISKIIPEACDAIYQMLKNEYLKVPNTEEEWLKHADLFEKKWNFPNCFGALDGKHVVMFAPPNCGSSYFNYKGTHSIVLMALADANYKIIYMDVGCKGRISDGGVFNRCSLSSALEQNTVNIPPAKQLTENGPPVPFVIVADDAFAMKPYIMKPYSLRNLSGPQRVYNYRLSRARRIVENVFGIMAARFRVLLKPIHLDEKKTEKCVLAICALHNFLMTRSNKYATANDFDRETVNGDLISGRWRSELSNEMLSLNRDQHTNPSTIAKDIQQIFTNYFVSPEGEVPWQYARI